MSYTNKLITIIIPCYNCADILIHAWESIRNQTIGIDKLECIFVDDASCDDGATWNKLQEIEKESPESVIVIRLEQNMRQGGARNVGIGYATGKYLMFLDSDDELTLDACSKAYDAAESNNADIVQFNHIRRVGNLEKTFKDVETVRIFEPIENKDREPLLDAGNVTYG
ncbi:MAG: glycosyltransferase [Lachnospiraceae bacterium]|nr:glycosyltransferase [Lachnospiraceae bacterium]